MIKRLIVKALKKIIYKLRDKTEIHLIHKLRNELPDFNLVFDIGTYHGQFVDLVCKYNNNLSIHCFEPTLDTYKVLKNKYIHNNNIILNNVAVSNYNGKSEFNLNSFSETNSLLQSNVLNDSIDTLTSNISKETVEVITLSDYIQNNNISDIDLIKIDSQGNSYSIIEGMKDVLLKKTIKYLYVEVEFIEIYKNEKLFPEINNLLNSLGYEIIDIYNLNYINKKLAWCDVLYSKK